MEKISLAPTREAQRSWAALPVRQRLKVLRRARQAIAANAAEFADAVALPGRRNTVETLPMEVLPLLDALRFLERFAERILEPRRLGRKGRPSWLAGVTGEIRYEPLGVVLVIGPFNYPLFLPGVPLIQALAAGNAVIVKPAPGHGTPMRLLRKTLVEAGMPETLLHVGEESAQAAQAAIASGVDKIVLTGSASTGRAVLARAAEHLVPAVVELSGNDAVFVLPGADLDHAARALAYGLRLNGGATCIAPRRVFVPVDLLPDLRRRLAEMIADDPEFPLGAATAAPLRLLLEGARAGGAEILGGLFSAGGTSLTPAIIVAPPRTSELLRQDIFAPVLSLLPVTDMADALATAAECPYRLGAAIFGPVDAAVTLAAQVDVGTVVVNDLIVSTADPRLPFAGRGQSGFGCTRGKEGLLEMTTPKSVIVRRSKSQRHFSAVGINHAELFLRFIAVTHGGGGVPALLRNGLGLALSAIRLR